MRPIILNGFGDRLIYDDTTDRDTMYTGFISDIRITLGTKVTWANGERCTYSTTLPWTVSVAMTHRLGEWGEWTKIPFLFIPKKSFEGKWVWGRNICMRIKPKAVDFEHDIIDADIMYDTKKTIFTRRLKGGA